MTVLEVLIKTYKAKKNFADNYFHRKSNETRLLEIRGIYKLRRKLSNDLRLRILENIMEISKPARIIN